MTGDHLVFRVHAIQRMFQRRITAQHVRHVLQTGEVIEQYPDDSPYPTSLVLGWHDDRPLHVVVADNTDDREVIVVTVYQPDPAQWDPDFRRKR